MVRSKTNFIGILLILIILLSNIQLLQARGDTTGLVAHYTFDTNANDSTGINNGQLFGGPVLVQGKIGNALQFDGVDDYVKSGTVSASGLTGFAYSFWIKTVQTSDSSLLDTGTARRFCRLNVVRDGKINCTATGSSSGGAVSLTTVNDGNWHHIVYSDQGNSQTLYVDGVNESSTSQLLDTTSGAIFIGNLANLAAYYSGAIDDIRIYNRALSVSEVSEIFAAGGGVQSPTQPQNPPATTTQPITPSTSTVPQDASAYTITPAAPRTVSWTPPIGIPEPSFGIKEDVTMYILRNGETCTTAPTKCFDYGRGIEPYRLNEYGEPYTHYINASSTTSTDTSNPFGTPDKPRKTIPEPIPPGSVLEIRGGSFAFDIHVYGMGTALRPIFIRGFPGHIFSRQIAFSRLYQREYIIIENIKAMNIAFGSNTHHVAIRNSEILGGVGGDPFDPNTSIHNVVLWKLKVHNSDTTWNVPGPDTDQGGIKFSAGAPGSNAQVYNLWIVDNEVFHNAGGGINTGNYGVDRNNLHHIYIGRNHTYENRQTSIGIKTASHVIISQNVIHGQITSLLQDGNWGAGVALQYSPDRVWVLFNRIYDTEVGVKIVSGSGTTKGENYIIGNVISDISPKSPSSSITNDGGYRPSAITGWDEYNHIVDNTIFDVDAGIYTPGAIYKEISGNIISNVRGNGSHIMIDEGLAGSSALTMLSFKNNLFYQPARNAVLKARSGVPLTLSAFESLYPNLPGNNTESDPLFVNPGGEDVRLQSGSLAVNTSSQSEVYQTFSNLYGLDIRKDFAGTSRPQGQVWDRGAYEFIGNSTVPTINKPGDFNKDGVVNSVDLSLMASAWNLNNTTYDLTKDGTVNTLDYTIMVKNWTN